MPRSTQFFYGNVRRVWHGRSIRLLSNRRPCLPEIPIFHVLGPNSPTYKLYIFHLTPLLGLSGPQAVDIPVYVGSLQAVGLFWHITLT